LPNSKIIRTTPETQGDSDWIPPGGTLGELVELAEARSRLLEAASDRETIAAARSGITRLSSRLAHDFVAVIAEVKRSSPSRGVINSTIDSGARVKEYEAGGASAISVLTEPDRFGGSDDDVSRVLLATALPVLRKDFHVTTLQLEHAARLGASAALVIVRSVSPSRLRELASAGRDLDLEIVFEVRDERELDRALFSDARVVGVNNRNLETLEIDRDTVSRIVPLVPPDCVAIAESGYSSAGTVHDAAAAGSDAVLVGSYLSAARDPVAAVKSIASVPRRPRGG
jgi:indole-3-glycerol phosphate synthase